MKKKLTMVGILAILLIGIFALGGCVTQGATGPEGPKGDPGDCSNCPECDCAASGGSTASLSWATDDYDVEDNIVVYGSGLPADKTITLYFADESTGRSLKWFKVTTSEVGGFRTETTIPTEANFDTDVFKDVTVNDDGFFELTVGAYDGSTLLTTEPIAIAEVD